MHEQAPKLQGCMYDVIIVSKCPAVNFERAALTPAAICVKPSRALAASRSLLPTLLMLSGACRGAGTPAGPAPPPPAPPPAAAATGVTSRVCGSC